MTRASLPAVTQLAPTGASEASTAVAAPHTVSGWLNLNTIVCPLPMIRGSTETAPEGGTLTAIGSPNLIWLILVGRWIIQEVVVMIMMISY